ncbi:receptor-type tyrosine-protein phosphatase mu [Nematolebias whitei]|uniref:receptor-type tyrosine-protein phosphatase mu n=1 Tax=Nematolebias whitei TaxID=451745 RepID=UPI00189A5957|nr:receptor-type tyrosine-protein phosphatase mu [Nematolebias whitei]
MGQGPDCTLIQSKEDDFDWEQGDTRDRPTSNPWIPGGSSFLFVNTSGRYSGQRAQLLLPPLKENETHCIMFQFYQAGGREGAGPATLNVYVKENNSPLGIPIFNSSGPAYHTWKVVELAVSTSWPNYYQLVFEAVSTGQRGVMAIKDIILEGHQCMNTPHFLHIKGVEVNAGQTATFHCTVNGQPRSNLLLYLQGMGGREAMVKETKAVNPRRYVASFDVSNTTKGDSGRYRCIAQSERGVEYRTMSGMLIDTTPVANPTHKISHLDPDTEYEISVLLTRPLEGGTGSPGPPLRARTKCADPMHGPQRLQVIDVQSKQVTIRWEPFGYNMTRCYSYNLTLQYLYRSVGGHKEVVYDTLSMVPQHTVRNLPPFTNVSLKLVLSNPEGRMESSELLVLTDEDVPGAIPMDTVLGSSYEQQISLSWKEPLQTYGLIRQYEISYKALSSFDTEFDLSNQSGKVFKPANETNHMFTGLYPGSTYSFTIRASTVKGFGSPVITQFTTKISAPLMPAYDQEPPLNQTDSTVTVLLKPAQSRGAPVSKYQVVVEEERPRRQRRGTAEILRCYPVPVHVQNASQLNSQYYFSAELLMNELRAAMPFCVGDNRTYNGYRNAPLLPHKSYGIYYQAVSSANGETKIDCVRVATKAPLEPSLAEALRVKVSRLDQRPVPPWKHDQTAAAVINNVALLAYSISKRLEETDLPEETKSSLCKASDVILNLSTWLRHSPSLPEKLQKDLLEGPIVTDALFGTNFKAVLEKSKKLEEVSETVCYLTPDEAALARSTSLQHMTAVEALTWLASVKDMTKHKNVCPLPER